MIRRRSDECLGSIAAESGQNSASLAAEVMGWTISQATAAATTGAGFRGRSQSYDADASRGDGNAADYGDDESCA
jgi:hypothetical protein